MFSTSLSQAHRPTPPAPTLILRLFSLAAGIVRRRPTVPQSCCNSVNRTAAKFTWYSTTLPEPAPPSRSLLQNKIIIEKCNHESLHTAEQTSVYNGDNRTVPYVNRQIFSYNSKLFGRGVKLNTHLQLVPRSRKCGSIHPLPHTSSWRNA
jgi:hypothetical protein